MRPIYFTLPTPTGKTKINLLEEMYDHCYRNVEYEYRLPIEDLLREYRKYKYSLQRLKSIVEEIDEQCKQYARYLWDNNIFLQLELSVDELYDKIKKALLNNPNLQ